MNGHIMSTDWDSQETQEWCDAFSSVVKHAGTERAAFLLQELQRLATDAQVAGAADPVHTAYINTLTHSPKYPGDLSLEAKLDALMRWNAVMMVMRAGKYAKELGGHIATYASIAVLFNTGFHHYFHAASATHGGDCIYFQGHASPGIYARALLEGRFDEKRLDRFRQEVDAPGLSSYPHPWLMPDFWQFPTVSMGLSPIMAIYQARFLKYLHARDLCDTADRKVWAFLGDGEMDEPESLGALQIAVKEKLDNLIFIVNCNLQRLDGPVRGNGKIIQELEGHFRGVGWHVIKVVWSGAWDALLAKDSTGILTQRMMEVLDGQYQTMAAKGGAYFREKFFGVSQDLLALVAHMSDEDLEQLTRGGHDPLKVNAAYAEAVNNTERPTIILAKTVKGFGMGADGEAKNSTHQTKSLSLEGLKIFRDRFQLPLTDKEVENLSYCRPAEDSPEIQYLKAQREALGGALPARRQKSSKTLPVPNLETFSTLLESSGDKELSTTMIFVRLLNILLKDKALKQHIVPIVPDESRTFGMEGLFRQLGIYSPVGQLYEPEDAGQLMFYKEDKKGQILQEGLNEGGAMSSWIAASTSYSTNDVPMIPFYIYYSMFGFQRIGDLAWAAGDMRARGFMLGGTAGRTTLAGEGLQHQDGHNHIIADMIPNCITYDPCFSYELAVIIQDGMRRMFTEQEDVFYYISVMNENYVHPAMPEGAEEGIKKGMYLLQSTGDKKAKTRVQLLGAGTILREVMEAADWLWEQHKIAADIWSVTSFNLLRRDGQAVDRHNRLHPGDTKQAYATQCLQGRDGPVIAATDYMHMMADHIRAYVPHTYVTLGTDGFGRSDTRKALRKFFEVNWQMVAYTTLKTLSDEGKFDAKALVKVMKTLDIDADKPQPTEE